MRSLYIASGSSRHSQVVFGRYWRLVRFFSALSVRLQTLGEYFTHEDTVATVILTVCIGELGSNIDAEQQNFKSPVCANVQIITYVMPSMNTAIATSLIGVTAWYAFILSADE